MGHFALVRRLDPEVWIWQTTTAERHIGIVRLPWRLGAFVLTAVAAIALTIATIGLYGIVSYTVAQRTYEVGIRMSLGAGSRSRRLDACSARGPRPAATALRAE
ncbi:MAG: hypothetical protein VYE73_18270 [Acidobacteriota bacterium]|nr:hypothetical protein [Acidobacteriota bacterium]